MCLFVMLINYPGSTVCCYDVFSISFSDDEVGVWFLQKTDIEKTLLSYRFRFIGTKQCTDISPISRQKMRSIINSVFFV
jgi:hypothetical protein